jgi:hypothetical protein
VKGNPFTFAAPSLLGIGRVSGSGELDGKKPFFTMDLGPSGKLAVLGPASDSFWAAGLGYYYGD